ncbi:MAG: DUF4012 domain-containing protein [Patescibacteria group bacterium]
MKAPLYTRLQKKFSRFFLPRTSNGVNLLPKRGETISRRRLLRWAAPVAGVVAGLSLLSSLFLIPIAIGMRDAADAANRGREALVSATERIEELDISGAEDALLQAEQEFAHAEFALHRLRPFERAFGIGDDVRAARELVRAGGDLARAGGAALRDSRALLSFLEPGNAEERVSLLQSIGVAAPVFRELRDRLSEIQARVRAIPPSGLVPPLRDARLLLAEKLADAQETAAAFGLLTEALPHFAGFPESVGAGTEAHTTLLLFQNETELRPTGGFWGTYGLATFAKGVLTDFHTDDVYALDGPAQAFLNVDPPAPLKKYLGISHWFLRDANWSPDFSVSARQGLDFFGREAPPGTPTPHAVLGLTSAVVADLLTVTGDIEIDGTRFTPENFTETLEFEVERGFVRKGIPRGERKDIVGRLGKELIARLSHIPARDAVAVLTILAEALSERHLLLFDLDPEVQNTLREAHWTGELPVATGDFLMVVDANLASLKSDPAVSRRIDYAVRPSANGLLQAHVAITYDHRGTFDWKTTRYRTFTRVYAPPGSRLISVQGAMENDRLLDPAGRAGAAQVGQESGLAVFGAFISIEPGTSKTLAFTYELPQGISERIQNGEEYALTVPKQAGTVGHPLTLDLQFGKNVRYAVPAEDAREWGDDRYRISTDLRVDRDFAVGF